MCLFHDPAATAIYTLSLHDALPISSCMSHRQRISEPSTFGKKYRASSVIVAVACAAAARNARSAAVNSSMSRSIRSEEHTSELQSQSNLVCRLLLEKKKHTKCTSQR